MIENSEPKKEVDYEEKELTQDIKNKSILFIKLILSISLVMLTFTLIWSIIK